MRAPRGGGGGGRGGGGGCPLYGGSGGGEKTGAAVADPSPEGEVEARGVVVAREARAAAG